MIESHAQRDIERARWDHERRGWEAERERLETNVQTLRAELDAALARVAVLEDREATLSTPTELGRSSVGEPEASRAAAQLLIGHGVGHVLRASSEHGEYPSERLLAGGNDGAWLSEVPHRSGTVEWIELGSAQPFVLDRIVLTGGVTYFHRILVAKRSRAVHSHLGGWVEVCPWSNLVPSPPTVIETLEDGTGLRELGVVRDVRVAVKLVSDEAGEQYIGCGGIEVWGYPV
jgi:hypothetical protein